MTTSSAGMISALMDYSAIDSINNYSLEYAKVSGSEYQVSSSSSSSSSSGGGNNNSDDATPIIIGVCVGVGVVVFCGIGFFLYRRNKLDHSATDSSYRAM